MKRLPLLAVPLASLFGHAVLAVAQTPQTASFHILKEPTGFFFSNFAVSGNGQKVAVNAAGEIFLLTAGKG